MHILEREGIMVCIVSSAGCALSLRRTRSARCARSASRSNPSSGALPDARRVGGQRVATKRPRGQAKAGTVIT